MQYKQFLIEVFEQKPGKWRVRVRRADKKPLKAITRKRIELSTADATSAEGAMIMAIEAIDDFAREAPRSTEKFWRRRTVIRDSPVPIKPKKRSRARNRDGSHQTGP